MQHLHYIYPLQIYITISSSKLEKNYRNPFKLIGFYSVGFSVIKMLGSGGFSPSPPSLVSKNFNVFIRKFGPQLSDRNQVIMHNLNQLWGRTGGRGREKLTILIIY